MQDVQRIAKKLLRTVKKGYPGVNEENAKEAVKTQFGLIVDFLDEDGVDAAEISRLFNSALADAAKDGQVWALSLNEIAFKEKFFPAFERAKSAGVNPVPVLQADCFLSEDEAKEILPRLEEMYGKKDEASIPAQVDSDESEDADAYADA